MSIKNVLVDYLTKWHGYVQSDASDFWFSESFGEEVTKLNTELESCTQFLLDNIEANEERAALVDNLHFLRNLLTSWSEGVYRQQVTPQHLDRLKERWLGRIDDTLARLADIDEEVVEDHAEVDEEVSKQRTLFSTPRSRRAKLEKLANKDFDGEGFLADAEAKLAEWGESRKLIPNGNSRNAEHLVYCRIPIIPKFDPYMPAVKLNKLGFKSEQLGTYLLLKDQLLLGIHSKWAREESMSHAEKDALVETTLTELSEFYGTEMVLAHDKSITDPEHGYTFYWVISSNHLNTLMLSGEAYPADWGMV